MPGPTQTPPLARTQFVNGLAAATGLNANVVRAWVAAEGGHPDNPLNIRRSDGGFGGFGSVSAAVTATVKFLQGSNYTAIRAAAKTNDPRKQLEAIVASPWEEFHYRGLDSSGKPIMSNPPGASLFGAYQSVVKGAAGFGVGDIAGGVAGAAGAVAGAAGDVAGGVGDLWSGVTGIPGAIQAGVKDVEQWTLNAALVGLAYLVLTGGSLGLLFLGLARLTAPMRASLAAGRAGQGNPAGMLGADEPIPF